MAEIKLSGRDLYSGFGYKGSVYTTYVSATIPIVDDDGDDVICGICKSEFVVPCNSCLIEKIANLEAEIERLQKKIDYITSSDFAIAIWTKHADLKKDAPPHRSKTPI